MSIEKKILVIGSQGYIGTVLCDYLMKRDYILTGVDNFIYNQKKINFDKKNYKFINCDPICSSGKNFCLSRRRPGFDSRWGNLIF